MPTHKRVLFRPYLKEKNNNKPARKEQRGLYRQVRREIEKLLTYDINKRRARFSKEDHVKSLVSASLLNAFAEGVSKSLRSAPSADTLLAYIKSQNQETLMKAFESQSKRSVCKLKKRRKLWKRVSIAMDWTDEMYYGDHKKTAMVNGTKAKNGSSYAFQFLTIAVLDDGERLVLGVFPIKSRNELPTLTLRALEKVRELGVKVEDVTVDAGFFSGEMIEGMKAEFEKNGLKYTIRMPENSKTKNMRIWDGRRFPYTLKVKKKKNSPPVLQRASKKQISFEVVAAYDKKKDHMYLFVTNLPYKSQTILQGHLRFLFRVSLATLQYTLESASGFKTSLLRRWKYCCSQRCFWQWTFQRCYGLLTLRTVSPKR